MKDMPVVGQKDRVLREVVTCIDIVERPWYQLLSEHTFVDIVFLKTMGNSWSTGKHIKWDLALGLTKRQNGVKTHGFSHNSINIGQVLSILCTREAVMTHNFVDFSLGFPLNLWV